MALVAAHRSRVRAGAARELGERGSGSSAAQATTLSGGRTPSAAVSGSAVTVTWPPSTYVTGQPVATYLVRRYNALTGFAATVLAGCSGVVNGLACTENGVPVIQLSARAAPARALPTATAEGVDPVLTVAFRPPHTATARRRGPH